MKTENKLEKKVLVWINTYKNKGYESKKSLITDLLNHGCVSGMVSELIYFSDTTKFYKRYQTEINELLKEILTDTGLSINELFGNKWDKEDPLVLDTQNQNLLAWFGFEETARILADKIGIEI